MIKQVRTVSGNVVDLVKDRIYPGTIFIENSRIVEIKRAKRRYSTYIIPGFVDSHIHIESSMITPAEFAQVAVLHGTVATVSDPHEIANVLGGKGVEYMIGNGKKTPFKFYFGAPSCVPATGFETSGASIGSKETDILLRKKEIRYLSEMMNYPGVINGERPVMAKIRLAQKYGKRIDGHAPGLTGSQLEKYVKAGISTDHETYTYSDALAKIKLGMKILIREGSAAKNFDALVPLLKKHPKMCMFCCDDLHPHELLEGHINRLVKKAVQKGLDVLDVLRCASVNPVKHYNLEVGLLQRGDLADFLVVDNLKNFKILKTYIDGQLVAGNGRSYLKRIKPKLINNFKTDKKTLSELMVKKRGSTFRVIKAFDGQLVTGQMTATAKGENGNVISDTANDILKIVVVNRYKNARPSVAFIKNFGLKKGAMASSVAHDSHNIIAVGVSDADILRVVNYVIDHQGGLAVSYDGKIEILPLSIAGLMSDKRAMDVAKKYIRLDRLVKKLGCNLSDPFMTLSFMALLVIPSLKLSDKGLFDADKFQFVDLFVK